MLLHIWAYCNICQHTALCYINYYIAILDQIHLCDNTYYVCLNKHLIEKADKRYTLRQ